VVKVGVALLSDNADAEFAAEIYDQERLESQCLANTVTGN
jgi:hypothetical protein